MGILTNNNATNETTEVSVDYNYDADGYDLSGRLDTVTENGVLIADYSYDSNSNRTGAALAANGIAASGCAATLTNVSASVDAQDRLQSFGNCTYTYTANGELTSKINTATSQTTTYEYDVFANLRSATLPNGDVLSYQIDGRNRRIGKSVNGVKVQGLVYANQLEPVAETDGAGNRIATFIYADRSHVPSMMIKNGNSYRIIADHLGSVRLVIDASDGTVVQHMDYDAWGNVLVDTNPGFQPFGYAGGIYDRDLKLVRFGARDYDPESGRWTAKDRIRFRGKTTNLYAYASVDPVNLIDMDGRQAVIPFPGFGWGFLPVAEGATGAIGLAGTVTILPVLAGLGLLLFPSSVGEGSDKPEPMLAKLPPGYWPADKGAEEWGRRDGCGKDEGRRRFHDIK